MTDADESVSERALISGLRTTARERLEEASRLGPAWHGYWAARDAAWRFTLEAWGREVALLRRDIAA